MHVAIICWDHPACHCCSICLGIDRAHLSFQQQGIPCVIILSLTDYIKCCMCRGRRRLMHALLLVIAGPCFQLVCTTVYAAHTAMHGTSTKGCTRVTQLPCTLASKTVIGVNKLASHSHTCPAGKLAFNTPQMIHCIANAAW